VGSPADAASDTYTSSVIEYNGAAELPEAQTLEQIIGNVTLEQDPNLTGSAVELILGSSFTGLSSSSSSGSSSTSSLAATYGGITGNTNICNDSAAFAGPDGPG
jgi:hypothetical protein